ncbi:COMM domain-containing protein 7 [Caerostris darwini]|uniref:COMM domain-containing protein 7 n=2 Tax=Caerostris TaxID=172845 RepID=A0AAV4VJD6_9ARAC|nr:COMM domain-containing protein 7 [Caerostris extrusa]GIY70256.1 COMM domain-containing protein 7 [Caerostris darwini]
MPDFELFQKLSQEVYLELLDTSFKGLTEKLQPSQLFSRYKTICSNSGVEFSELEPLLQQLLQLSRDAARKNKSLTQLHDELLNLGLNEDLVDLFTERWEKVHSSLVQTSVAETIPINPLIDMEWKFGVTSASSQSNTVGNVFLQMKLDVDQGNGRIKTVCFELQLSEFYAFLHEMERARASLDYLS